MMALTMKQLLKKLKLPKRTRKKLLKFSKVFLFMIGVSSSIHIAYFLFISRGGLVCWYEPNFLIRWLEIFLTSLTSLFLFYTAYLMWGKK